mgnify:CR=1 FL=1
MVATVAQIIGKINPKLYAENGTELLKKYGSIDRIPAEEVKPKVVRYTTQENGNIKISEQGNSAEHTLVYESYSETLEPLYFFIIDLMNDRGLAPEKLIDNFSPTPGSPHFAETGMKMARMQEEATKMMQTVGILTKSVLQIIYDLRDFKIRFLLHLFSLKCLCALFLTNLIKLPSLLRIL